MLTLQLAPVHLQQLPPLHGPLQQSLDVVQCPHGPEQTQLVPL